MNSNRHIKLCIITPVYNRQDCIGRCIDSVIRQDYEDKEMWIIDDGSTDDTSLIIKSYLAAYPFIRYHKFDKNKGVNAARNYGIQHSNGDYIVFLDSDDMLVDNILSYIATIINKYPTYKQYLFSTDDRVEYYARNEKLSNEYSVLEFSDFLSGKVAGDFFHVISCEMLKKYPFPEHIRIYELLIFLQLYRESSEQLFHNKVALKRDRNRKDSVTQEYKLTSLDAIRKKFTASSMQLEIFEEEYLKYDKAGNFVTGLIKETYLLGLASGNYQLEFLESLIKKWNKRIPSLYILINKLKAGRLVRYAINAYSKSKTALK